MVKKLKAEDIFNDIPIHFNYFSNVDILTQIHSHNFYELFLVIKGTTIHKINNIEQKLQKNSLVFLRPSDIHYFKKIKKEECHFLNLAFTEKVYKQALNFINPKKTKELTKNIPQVKHISANYLYNIKLQIENLNTIVYSNNKAKIIQYKNLLLTLISQYLIVNSINTKSIPDWLYHIYNEIQKKENFIKGRDAIMQLSTKSEEYTCRMFKKYIEKTPTEFINNLKLNYATNLLLNTDKSIINISLTAGFNNLSHFYHLFKEKHEIAPGKFRKSKQKHLQI